MDGLQAIQQLNDLQIALNETINLKGVQGKELADAEKEYKIALQQQVLILKDQGMAATLINLVVYGMPEVAELRYRRDFAKSRYEVSGEKINALKLNIRVLQDIIDKEWGRA